VLRGHEEEVQSVAFSPDGRTVLTTGWDEKTARLWEVATGREIATLRHEKAVWSAAFSPDGHTVVTGSLDNTARLWEVSTGNEIATFRHESPVASANFSPDGRTVVTAGSRTVRLWEVATGKEIAALRGYQGWLTGYRVVCCIQPRWPHVDYRLAERRHGAAVGRDERLRNRCPARPRG
jgi:WD40 repeat protein